MSPLISCIVTHHLPENRPYLDLALKGLLESEGVDIEIILGSSYQLVNLPNDDRIKLLKEPDLNTCTKKIESAVKHMAPDSDYLFMQSDDVFLSKRFLFKQRELVRHYECLAGCFSNGEVQTRLIVDVSLPPDNPNISRERLRLHPDMTMEQFTNHLKAAQDFEGLTDHILLNAEWFSFYAVMMRKSTWNKVGPLDPVLDLRHNDQDYCYRARAMGIPSVVNLGAYCTHFGSKSMKYESSEAMDAATFHFRQKRY